MAKRVDNTLSYKIGYGIGTMVYKAITGLFKLIWKGTIKSSLKNIYIASIYVFLSSCTFVSYLIIGDISIMITVTLLVAVSLGIYEYIKEYPVRKKRKYYARLFENVNLKASDGSLPYYLYETRISEYAITVSFATVIPLNFWQIKKDTIEMELNVKILDITQDKENNRIINIIIEINPLPDLIHWTDDFIDIDKNILNIGLNHYGVKGIDLEKYPHAFIAGETGSGKSNILKCLIHQALLKEYRVTLIDFKRGVSFSTFNNIVPVYYEYDTVTQALRELVTETIERLDKFRSCGVDNINDYNRCTTDYLPRKIIFIDELAELLKTRDKETSNILYDSIETLTRLSRAVGIHLIMGIQRPDSTIVNGQIKNNVSYRVCGRFVDKEPSRIMLGDDIASNIANIKGRFIIKDDEYYEVQSFYFMGDISMRYKKQNENTIKISNINKMKEEVSTNNISEPKLYQKQPKTAIKQAKEEQPQAIQEFNFDFSDMTFNTPVKAKTQCINAVKIDTVWNREVIPPINLEEKRINIDESALKEKHEKYDYVEYELKIIENLREINENFNNLKKEQDKAKTLKKSKKYQTNIKSLEERTYFLADKLIDKNITLLNDITENMIVTNRYTIGFFQRVCEYMNEMKRIANILKNNYKDTDEYDTIINEYSKYMESFNKIFEQITYVNK